MTTTSAQSSLCNVRLAVLLVVFLTASSLSAQVVTVTIQGRVYDTTGAAISQANVSVTNPATGFSRSATASATGEYQISGLPVGDYTVTVEKSGFQRQAKKVHLDIGASARGLQPPCRPDCPGSERSGRRGSGRADANDGQLCD